MKNTRFGRIKIARKYIEDYLDMVLKVMARCVIVRCEMNYMLDVFDYIAISPDFDEVSEGDKCPSYNVIVENGCVRFEKSDSGQPPLLFDDEVWNRKGA